MSCIHLYQGRRGLCLKGFLAIIFVAASLFIYYKDTLKSVGKELGLRFPATAKAICIIRSEAPPALRVKVEMPAADFPKFFASTPVYHNEFIYSDAGVLGLNAGALGLENELWDPEAHDKTMHSAQTDIPSLIGSSHRVLNIGYDDSRGSVVVVYVYCWEYM